MKKQILNLFCIIGVLGLLTACSDDNDPTSESSSSYFAYVVNNGNWNANNGTIMGLSENNGTISCSDIYQLANGYGIGDAQDACYLNGKLYVTSTTSSKVEVLSSDGKLISRTSLANAQPREIVASTDKKSLYFTAYNGKLYRWNARSYALTDSVSVGAYPEGLCVSNGKIYICLSDYKNDGSGKQIAVVSESSFKLLKTIDVERNPYSQILAVGKKVYFVSNLDYSDNILQVIDAETDVCSKIGNATTIAYDQLSNELVCIYSVWGKSNKRYFRYDCETGKEVDITGLDVVSSLGQLSVNPKNGDIYLVDNSYSAPCTLYVFGMDGTQKRSFQSGYGTMWVRFAQ